MAQEKSFFKRLIFNYLKRFFTLLTKEHWRRLQAAKSKGQRAKGKGQRAKGKGQRAKGKGQRAKGKGQRAKGKKKTRGKFTNN
jgi:hypothetical protein